MQPVLRLIISAISSAITGYALYLDTTKIPLAVEGAVLGKGIYLTYQTEWILATYFFIEFVAAFFRFVGKPIHFLDELAHWASPFAGGFGLFLTIMFYWLVWFDENFQHDVVRHFESQGIPMIFVCHLVHAPPAPLVLLDTLTKHSGTVHSCVSSPLSYLKYYLAFAAEYIFVMRWNFSVTKKWVYPFQDKFTAEWHHWAFYFFCFGWIWLLSSAHRLLLVSIAGDRKYRKSGGAKANEMKKKTK